MPNLLQRAALQGIHFPEGSGVRPNVNPFENPFLLQRGALQGVMFHRIHLELHLQRRALQG